MRGHGAPLRRAPRLRGQVGRGGLRNHSAGPVLHTVDAAAADQGAQRDAGGWVHLSVTGLPRTAMQNKKNVKKKKTKAILQKCFNLLRGRVATLPVFPAKGDDDFRSAGGGEHLRDGLDGDAAVLPVALLAGPGTHLPQPEGGPRVQPPLGGRRKDHLDTQGHSSVIVQVL